MPDVFISHATTDDVPVSQLAARLREAGITTWVDHEQGITVGDPFNKKIQQAVNDSQAGLFIISPRSVISDYCEAEWTRILSLGKKLYMALIEPVSLPEIPLRLGSIQYANLSKNYDFGLSELIAAITGRRDLNAASPATEQARPISGPFPRWQFDLPLIGRGTELKTALDSLANNRVTAVLGLGGIGKTRLAAEITQQVNFRSGMVWHDCRDSNLATLTLLIRDHLRLPPAAEHETIWAEAGRRGLLIVLDNGEDCKEPAAYAAHLNALDQSNGTRVLLTSRAGWTELHGVRTLDLHAPDSESAVAILKVMAAYEPPAFPIVGHELALAEAAHRHPRLMQYALRWLNTYPPEYVLNLLRTLKGSDAEEALHELVQRTVEQFKTREGGPAAIDALRRLTVTRGGFTFEAALALMEALTRGPSPSGRGESDSLVPDSASLSTPDSPRKLALLKQWGLVALEGQRYQIDPLVIAAVGEDDSAHLSHYGYYKALAQQHNKKQDYLGLDPESANLEAAFEWAMAVEENEDAYGLYTSVGQFLPNRGRYEQRMNWMLRLETALANHPNDALRANVQNELGILYSRHPLGDHQINLRRAIMAFEAALVYRTPQASPLDYAKTQNNLGNAFGDLAEIEDRAANLHRAIKAYEAALVYRTPQTTPLDFAATQNNLGFAYWGLSKIEDPEINLKRAITSYEAALIYWTPQTTPIYYAFAHNNLGNAYRDLAQIEDQKANLKRAITAYEASLVYGTPQAAPLDYAQAQNNLGLAYWDLSRLEDREANLKRAITAYEAALVYYTPQTAPLGYAMAQGNLGLVRQDFGDLPAAITCWREAERYYRQIHMTEWADKMLQRIAEVGGE